jgi:putative transposase
MPDYRRNCILGACYFFTVNLLDRRSQLLVANISALRDAVIAVAPAAPLAVASSSPSTVASADTAMSPA